MEVMYDALKEIKGILKPGIMNTEGFSKVEQSFFDRSGRRKIISKDCLIWW
ncbi:MAG: hypothetical protein MZV63_21365 [Marinilabiliales bacterium]|nr:hypothetical protein [Marinilabiliales bacterium]